MGPAMDFLAVAQIPDAYFAFLPVRFSLRQGGKKTTIGGKDDLQSSIAGTFQLADKFAGVGIVELNCVG